MRAYRSGTPTRRRLMVPTVTLVVAMRNEAANIANCLDSIAAQDHPADHLEVLVYDGESDDDSVAIARGSRRRPAGMGGAFQPAAHPGRRLECRDRHRDRRHRGHRQRARRARPGLRPARGRGHRGDRRGHGRRPRQRGGRRADRRGGLDRHQHAVRGRRGASSLRDGADRGRHRVHGPGQARDLPALPVRRVDGPQPGRRAELPAARRGRPDRVRPGDRQRVHEPRDARAACGPSTSTTAAGRSG